MSFEIKRLNSEEFEKFSKLIYDESGIYMKDSKITLLSNRLRKRLKALELDSFMDYYKYIQGLTGNAKTKEYDELIDAVSTNETYFFRNERHFGALEGACLPEIAREKKNKTLRIWSAACSTGEEPYTIAISILENMHLFPGWNIEIIASDIAVSVLDFARKGVYSGRRIDKVPPSLLTKYFQLEQEGEKLYGVKESLKNLVTFKALNFFKDEFPTNIDIIFCRNVMIYFDKIHQRRLIADFYKSINEKGYLFIGHSETLHSISEDFTYSKIMDAPVYLPKPKGGI